MNVYSALFIPAKRSKHSNVHYTDGQINERWYSHTTEYYLAVKKGKVLIHATTWMNLENIILSERNQSQKTINYVILFMVKSRIGKFVQTESTPVVT